MKYNRVVITGIGVVSSIGNSYYKVLKSLLNFKSGIIFSKKFKKSNLKCNVYAPIKKINKNFNINNNIFFKYSNKSSIYAYISMIQAIKDSNLNKKYISNNKTGLIVGNGCYTYDLYNKNNLYKMIKNMPSNVSAFLSGIFNIKGITYSISSACSTSLYCIKNSFEYIRNGHQNIMFSGGCDSLSINTAKQFDSFRLLSKNFNFCPKKSSRPYDINRDGIVLSEGSGVIVLEELNHAIKRKAKIYAEVVSYGLSTYNINMLSPSSKYEYISMKNSLINSKINKIDYINSHGTSTKIGDISEILAIKKLFKKYKPKISSTKSISGHSLGSSGVHSLIFSIIMMKNNFLFPNINISNLDKEFKNVNLILLNSNYKKIYINNFMINNFAFGGFNISFIFKRFIF